MTDTPNGNIFNDIKFQQTESNILLGSSATINASSGAVAVGNSATASADDAVALGPSSTADTEDAIAIGDSASSTGTDTVALGVGASASASDGVAIGPGADASSANGVAIGRGASTSEDSEIVFGDGSSNVFAIRPGTSGEIIDLQNSVEIYDMDNQTLSVTTQFADDAGTTTLVDQSVTSSPAAGTAQTISLSVDSNSFVDLYAEADGSGGIQNAEIQLPNYGLGLGGNTLDNVGSITNSTDIVEGDEINLSDIAGDNITVDGTNNELDTPAWSTVTKTSNYTASNYENVLADASGGSLTITLPSPTTGTMVSIKAIDASNTVTIATPNTESIDGSSNQTIDSTNTSLTITSDGSNYFIV